jgi:hypothetical protein
MKQYVDVDLKSIMNDENDGSLFSTRGLAFYLDKLIEQNSVIIELLIELVKSNK